MLLSLSTRITNPHNTLETSRRVRLCLVGSKKAYPAYDSTYVILEEVLGTDNISECRINDFMGNSPSLLKLLFSIVNDVYHGLTILKSQKQRPSNFILIFQGYFPLTCMLLNLTHIKTLLYIGGSGFYWSHIENKSLFGRVLVYSNILIEKICHKNVLAVITLSEKMTSITNSADVKKVFFALPRLDKYFFNKFFVKNIYSERANIIGFLGGLVKRKGIMELIDAISLLKNKDDYRFIIVGDGPLLNAVRNKVHQTKSENKVKVIGFAKYSDLPEYLNEMKLFVLPSYAEGIPSTIFEAMACGTPVLTTPVGGITEVIKEKESGFFLSSFEPEKIARKIEDLLDDPILLNNVSINASKLLRKKFSHEKVLDSWREIVNSIADT